MLFLVYFLFFLGSGALRGSYRSSAEPGGEGHNSISRASVYVFVDKAHMKVTRCDLPKAQFIPIEYADIRKLRHSFKKLRRACHPSSLSQVAQVIYN